MSARSLWQPMENQLTAVLRKNLGNVKNKDMILSKVLNNSPPPPQAYLMVKENINKLSFKEEKKIPIFLCLLILLAEA